MFKVIELNVSLSRANQEAAIMDDKKEKVSPPVELFVNKYGNKTVVRAEGVNPDAVLAAAQAHIEKAREGRTKQS